MPAPLRFLAKGAGMTPNYAAQAGGIRCFHGYKFDSTLGPKVAMRDEFGRSTAEVRNHGAFVKSLGEIVTVDFFDQHRGEYIRHLRDGDLWPADEYTAQLAGVAFDPKFGGEHDDAAKAAQDKELDAQRDVASQPLPTPPAPPKKG